VRIVYDVEMTVPLGKRKVEAEMRKFYNWIVNHARLVITIFVIAFIICIFCKNMVLVNYDMNDYLPENSPSTVALDLMDKEFGGGVPNARVMLENVSIPEALEYKEKIKKCLIRCQEMTVIQNPLYQAKIKMWNRCSLL